MQNLTKDLFPEFNYYNNTERDLTKKKMKQIVYLFMLASILDRNCWRR